MSSFFEGSYNRFHPTHKHNAEAHLWSIKNSSLLPSMTLSTVAISDVLSAHLQLFPLRLCNLMIFAQLQNYVMDNSVTAIL